VHIFFILYVFVHLLFSHRVYTTMEELIADYECGNLHPGDLKSALTDAINKILQVIISVLGLPSLFECACFESLYLLRDLNEIFFLLLQPVRDHFKNDSAARDLLRTVKVQKFC
jgi:hypothetical protein